MSEHEPPDSGKFIPGQLPLLEGDVRARSPWWRRLLVGGIALTLLLVLAAGSIAGYLAWTNKARADDWQARAVRLERDNGALEEVVTERTRTLNERIEDLNALAEKVAAAEQAIERSEADVKRLERRQRQLAAEKADVEDARAALALQTAAVEDVASAYIDCKDGLTALLGYVLNENYYGASGLAPQVDSDCGRAEAALDSYLRSYD